MPDSIVPGISSQALNRYMYVMGNPINFSDPSGYLPCEGANGCKGGKSRIPELEKFSDIEDYLFFQYSVSLTGEWSITETFFAIIGVKEVDDYFKTFGSSFNQAMQNKPIELIKVEVENNWLLAQIDPISFSYINFYNDSDFTFSSELLIHELAHIFDYRIPYHNEGVYTPTKDLTKSINWSWFINKSSGMNPNKQFGDYYDWGPNTILYEEIFADVFLMMVTDNNPNKTDKAYIMWKQIMDDGMPYWLQNKNRPVIKPNYYPHE